MRSSEAEDVQFSPRVVFTIVLLVSACVATIALLGPRSTTPEITLDAILLAIALVILIIAADFFEVDAPLASERITVSVSAPLCFAAAITLGPLAGAVIAGIGALVVEVVQRTHPVKALVNVVNYVFAAFVGGFVYQYLADVSLSPIGSVENVIATILGAAAYTIVDTGSISIVIAQVLEKSPFQLWVANFRGAIFEHISLPTLGIIVPILYQESVFALIIVVIPLLGPYLAFRNYRQVHEETRATLNVLADMLDRRDPYTAEHSQRVCELVDRMLNTYKDVSFAEYESILIAARIHDLGKITTSDAVLLKPGRLEPHEWDEMKRHSSDGAEILSHISMFDQVSKIIRHHHERWDGKGYPDGIAGEQIPLGSRVIAVADTYDAMTTDRPYRGALSHQIAVDEIRKNAGKQFDPAAVDAFLQVIDPPIVTNHSAVVQEAGHTD